MPHYRYKGRWLLRDLLKSLVESQLNHPESKNHPSADESRKLIAAKRMMGEEGDLVGLFAAGILFSEKALNCPLENPGHDAGRHCGVPDIESKRHAAEKKALLWLYQKAIRLCKASDGRKRSVRKDALEAAIHHLDRIRRHSEQPPDRKRSRPPVPMWKISEKLGICYFKRGICVLPKGDSMPPEKHESFEKALEAANKALAELTEIGTQKSRKRLLILRASILGELWRLLPAGYENLLRQALKGVIDQGLDFMNENGLVLIDLYCRLFPNDDMVLSFYDALSQIDRDPSRHDTDTSNFFMIRALAAVRANKIDCRKVTKVNVLQAAREAVDSLQDKRLYHSSWDDAIDLIETLKDGGIDSWADLSISAWRFCDANQPVTGIQVRHYWSRLEKIYLLTLAAALLSDNDAGIKTAAEITDSLKAKSARAWNFVLEVLRKRHSTKGVDAVDRLRRYYEGEALLKRGAYAPGHEKSARIMTKKQRADDVKPVPIDCVPPGCTAMHLLCETDTNGQPAGGWCFSATQLKNTQTPLRWNRIPLRWEGVWQAYCKWEEAYRKSVDLNQAVGDLCRAMGATLKKALRETEKHIIWIPHGFTHRLPLHAAKDPDDGEYLFQKKTVSYLPAWHLQRKNVSHSGNDDRPSILLHHFNDFEEEKEKMKGLFKEPPPVFNADRESLLGLGQQPKLLALRCHGLAHETDPFKSSLLLKDGKADLVEIQASGLDLTGTTLVSTACGTEMTPNRSSRIDEHVSLASTFLGLGCAQIVGALWSLDIRPAFQMMKAALDATEPLALVFSRLQQQWFKDGGFADIPKEKWETFPEEHKIHLLAPIRVIGYSVSGDTEKSETAAEMAKRDTHNP